MILLALILQTEAPDISGAAWQYLGRTAYVAHYADANSVRRHGNQATVVYRFISVKDGGRDRLTQMAINCAENYGAEGASFEVESDGVKPTTVFTFTGVRLPGYIFDTVGTAIKLACKGENALPVSDPLMDARTAAPQRPVDAH